jgi:hypothetical protein
MWVTSKKRVLFQKARLEDSPKNEKMQVVDEEFILEPNIGERALDPVSVPDWIKDTDMYKLLRKEGSINEAHGPAREDEDESGKDESDKEKETKSKADKADKTGLQSTQHPWKK